MGEKADVDQQMEIAQIIGEPLGRKKRRGCFLGSPGASGVVEGCEETDVLLRHEAQHLFRNPSLGSLLGPHRIDPARRLEIAVQHDQYAPRPDRRTRLPSCRIL